MAKNNNKWIVELSYTELTFLKIAVENYKPSGIILTEQDKDTTIKAINNAKYIPKKIYLRTIIKLSK